MDEEIWDYVPRFNKMVKVSTLGRIKSFYRYTSGKIIRCIDIDCFGYARVRIKGKRYKIHRLVAETFIPNPGNKREVNHKDGNKLNNRADNLEWATRSENQKHAYKIGLQKPSKKQKQAVSKWNKENRIKKVYQYDDNGNLIHIYSSQQEASIALNIKTSTVSRILHGQKTNRYNYILKYD